MPTDKRRSSHETKTSTRSVRDQSVDKIARKPSRDSKETKEVAKRRDDSRNRSKSIKDNSRVVKDSTSDRKERSHRRDLEVTEKPLKDKLKAKEIKSDKLRSHNRTESNHRSSRIHSKGEADKIGKKLDKNEGKQSRDITRTNEEKIRRHRSQTQNNLVEETKIRSRSKTIKNHVKQEENSRTEETNVDESYSYEDDFEDYESDFESEEAEDDSGVEEEEEAEKEKEETIETQLENDIQETNKTQSPTPDPVKAPRKLSNVIEQYRLREKQSVILALQAENKNVEQFRQESAIKRGEPMNQNDNQNISRKNSDEITTNHFINFTSAKRRQSTHKAMSKSLSRKIELFDSNRISMHEMPFDVFDLPPVGYDVYIKIFGRSNAKQIYTQTNDDDLSEEIQTDEIEYTEKWTQYPALGRWCSGGDSVKNVNAEELENSVKSDSAHLSKFIQLSSEVMISLLEERTNSIEKTSPAKESTPNSLFNSSNCIRLGEFPFRQGCPVTFVQFSIDEPQLLLTIHAAADEELVDEMPELGVMCVWNIYQPLLPLKILSSYSQPLCACFNPGKANIAFAGLIDGSLLLWDLRESSSIHRRIKSGDKEFILRRSTYSTAEILRDESHRSPVVCIRAAQMTESSLASIDYSEQQLTFRVASLEEYGIVKLWTAIEIMHSDMRGTDSDLGLAPGSTVRLIRSQTIDLRKFPGLEPNAREYLRTFDLQFLPTDCNHLFITTDSGFVIHCDSLGAKLVPALYKSDSISVTECHSIEFSNLKDPLCFLVGCNDGSIRLHSVNKDKSAMSWPNAGQGEAVSSVHWAGGGACVFYVLDVASRIHIWDLSQNESNPIVTKEFTKHNILNFHVNGRTSEAMNKTFQVAIAFDDGSVEIHHITPVVPQVKPTKILSNLLQMT